MRVFDVGFDSGKPTFMTELLFIVAVKLNNIFQSFDGCCGKFQFIDRKNAIFYLVYRFQFTCAIFICHVLRFTISHGKKSENV